MKQLQLFLRNIKKGFATNSSSYHSTLVMTDEEYQKWKKGEVKVRGYSYDTWYEDYEYEQGSEIFTTPNGEKIHILYQYGYNG